MALMSGLQGAQRDVHVLAECLPALVELHHTTSRVVLAMPNDLIAGGLVQDQSEGRLGLPHFPGDIVSSAQLVTEALAFRVDHQATHAAQGLGRQELDLGLGVIGLHQACGVNLHPFQVDAARTNGFAHLDTISGGVVTVGSGKVQEVRPVLGQQGIIRKVGAKAPRGQNHGAFLGEVLALLLVGHATNSSGLSQELLDLGLVDDSRQVTALRNLLHHLDQSIGDGHSRETLLATMGAGSRMTTETSQEGHVQVELVHQPIDVRAAVSTEHLHQLRFLGSALQGIGSKELDGVLHLLHLLGLRLCPVDATGGFGGISTAEGAFVHQDHLAAALQDRIRCGDARQATTHHDRLRHDEVGRGSRLEDVGVLMVLSKIA
mmetsp:Transcript_51518/g.84392  ORF Transcript_51518/g.84392 Transcript_51518/m.84392 type:complete len:376 (-) Transcript_51518:12-1139(-)